ncbi:MAG TPA: type II CAAX endopeptidase family protein [Pyrinomonadaceae bacterium]|nr:type II CAAX endopeptidase family protein [Pyrinomonadaceae bacterium]
MNLSEIFFNRWDRLRSGWRVALFIIINYALAFPLFLLLTIGYMLLLRVRNVEEAQGFLRGPWGWVFQSAVLLTAATVAGFVCARLLEGLPLRSIGWTLHRGYALDWLKGTLIGAISLILATLIIFVSGGYRFSFAASNAGAVLKTLLFSGLVFILAAAAEEALFRGYPLQTMTRAKLAVVGMVLTSLVFAYVHKDNPNNPPGLAPFTYIGLYFVNFPFINTALAGAWLAVAYLRTRSLWFPLGVHWSWNWTMGALLGLPVSGIEALTPAPLLRAADTGPEWLTGGAYGLEAGAACTLALLASTIFLWRTRLLSATPEMLSLTDKENPKQGAYTAPEIAEESLAGEDRTPV